MQYEYPSPSIEIEARRSMLDEQTCNPEVAIKARFAQEFGHIALRHADDEVSKTDYNRFHELYVDKLMKHSLVIDRSAVSRDFDIWVDTMLPAAQADIDDVLSEQEIDRLPEFVSPSYMSEMTTSADDKLLHDNLRLVEENARFMNQLVGMSQELRKVKDQLRKARKDYEDLVIDSGSSQREAIVEI